MKNKLLLLSFLLLVQILPAQSTPNDVVKLILNGKKYEKILLILRLDGANPNIQGTPDSQSDWTFAIPDSARPRIHYMEFLPVLSDTLVQFIFFKVIIGTDTLNATSRMSPNSTITGKYLYSTYKKKAPELDDRDFAADYFLIENPDIELYIQPYLNNLLRDLSKEEKIKKYKETVRRYPKTEALMNKLYLDISRYYSMEEIAGIYECFDNSLKESYYGKKVKKFLTTVLTNNPFLPEYKTGRLEPLIRDTTKYNLVIFSASWCGYCHLQIPLLKDIYNDLKDDLEMTYISTDRPKDISKWIAIMKEKEIPWRSLLAGENRLEINYYFSIQSIPHAILFYPGGKTEVIDVRKPEQKEKLYNLVKKQKQE